MNFNNIGLLLSNIGNLPSKVNKNNDHSTLGFDKILESIKNKFENFENNINGIDGKNLPEAIKIDFISKLEGIEQALQDLVANEEKISLSKEESLINVTDLINKEMPIAKNNLLKDINPVTNIISDLKGVIENIKEDLRAGGGQTASLKGNGILQDIYIKLEDMKNRIIDNSKITNDEDNQQPLRQKSIIENVKAAVENTMEKLAGAINHEVAEGKENSVRLQHGTSNLLSIIEQFNKQLKQNISSVQRNVTGRLADRGIERLAVKSALINSLFDGDVKKVLLSHLNNEINGNSHSTGPIEGSDFNFIDPNKVDLAFKETFLENKKDKENTNNVKDKTGNVDKNSINKTEEFGLIKEVNTKNKDHQINKELNISDKSQNIEVANKDSKALNYRIDYMTIDAAKSDKSLINNINENLQNNQTVKDVANKLIDYIKFIKQENIAKAELRLNIENIGKLKILFTDVGDKINARIYTENDNVKHFVSMAFDNIKENLVQKGINLSQYDFYHLNKDNQENHSEQNNQKSKSNYTRKEIEKIEEKQPLINALYA
jgi:flagellar hook-length control protein FliK